ncbi:hypothetical protein VTO42DRAFT_8619 [Malbranchea cinnamomea]
MAPMHLANLCNLLLQERYSDFTITCGGRTFPAHRAIVCVQSRFFEAALDGKFAEAQSKNVTLVDEDFATVERMLSFMYTGDYQQEDVRHDSEEETNGERPSAMSTETDSDKLSLSVGFNNVKLYVVADKYGIEPLKALAQERFIDWFKRYSGEELAEVTRFALKSPPPHDDCLRKAIIDTVTDLVRLNLEWLAANDELINVVAECGAIDELLKELVAKGETDSNERRERMEKLRRRVLCAGCHLSPGLTPDQGEMHCARCQFKALMR